MIDVQSDCFISSRYFDIELSRLVNITWQWRVGKINCERQSWFVTRILLYEIIAGCHRWFLEYGNLEHRVNGDFVAKQNYRRENIILEYCGQKKNCVWRRSWDHERRTRIHVDFDHVSIKPVRQLKLIVWLSRNIISVIQNAYTEYC